jgi:signal recognition particle subunit SRP54
MNTDPFSLDDFRRDMAAFLKPYSLLRIMWWLAMLFQPREIRNELGDAFNHPELKSHFRQAIGIIDAMTLEELAKPRCIDRLRMIRIAKGAGVALLDVENLLGIHESMRIARLTLRNSRGNPNNDHPR